MNSVSDVRPFEPIEVRDFFKEPTGKVGFALLKKFISEEGRDYPQAFNVSKRLIEMLTQKELAGRTQGAIVGIFSDLSKLGHEKLSRPFYGWIRFALAWNSAKKELSSLDKTLADYEKAASDGCSIARHFRAELLQEAGRKEEAIQEWEACVKQYPEDKIARDALAKLQNRAESKSSISAEMALFDGALKSLHTLQEQMQAKDAQIASLTEEVKLAKGALERIPRLEQEVALYRGKFTEAVKMFSELFPHIEPPAAPKKPD